jgi:hypothetical protein
MLGDASPYIRPGFEKEYADIFAKAFNFFKHGAKDPLATHYFAPESNEYVMLDGCEALKRLSFEERPLMRVLIIYLSLHEPRIFKKEFTDHLAKQAVFTEARHLSKRAFFNEWLPIATMIPAQSAWQKGKSVS